jgi:hypothetical protein
MSRDMLTDVLSNESSGFVTRKKSNNGEMLAGALNGISAGVEAHLVLFLFANESLS